MRFIFTFMMCLIMAACATEGIKDINGQNYGKPVYTNISIEKSKVTLPAKLSQTITKIVHIGITQKYVEEIHMENGLSMYEYQYRGGFRIPVSDKDFQLIFNGHEVLGTPLQIPPWDLKVNKHDIKYAFFQRPYMQCIAYSKGLGEKFMSQGQWGQNALIYGTLCENGTKPDYPERALSLIKQIQSKL
ncbi:hypothetical protein [Terasakiella sp. SH-1]|uniref:hypothetical protein n=1 Tax=Terasakiella sp. SH-1 TaxID=2560057 RepID=UPI0010731548|nr:hypothetical protein [Terasakiella sp. SH-1]